MQEEIRDYAQMQEQSLLQELLPMPEAEHGVHRMVQAYLQMQMI
jgi:hypothetical protein